MKKTYILDTNFVLRYLLKDSESQYKKAKIIFDQAKSGKISLILEQSVFAEIIFVLSSCYGIPRSQIVEYMLFLITYKGIEGSIEHFKLALSYFKDKNIHIVDSLVLAKSQRENIELLTFDKKLEKISRS